MLVDSKNTFYTNKWFNSSNVVMLKLVSQEIFMYL